MSRTKITSSIINLSESNAVKGRLSQKGRIILNSCTKHIRSEAVTQHSVVIKRTRGISLAFLHSTTEREIALSRVSTIEPIVWIKYTITGDCIVVQSPKKTMPIIMSSGIVLLGSENDA